MSLLKPCRLPAGSFFGQLRVGEIPDFRWRKRVVRV
jgi:hypothetical protein